MYVCVICVVYLFVGCVCFVVDIGDCFCWMVCGLVVCVDYD